MGDTLSHSRDDTLLVVLNTLDCQVGVTCGAKSGVTFCSFVGLRSSLPYRHVGDSVGRADLRQRGHEGAGYWCPRSWALSIRGGGSTDGGMDDVVFWD